METVLVVAALPVLLALLSAGAAEKKSVRCVVAVASWLQLLLVAWAMRPFVSGAARELPVSADLGTDRLGAMFIILTTLVVACSLTHGYFFFEREMSGSEAPGRGQMRAVYACINLFLVAMSMVFLCNNLGYLWIAVEATTLCSAPLVYFSRTKHALEATWKYLIICSVGIAFALLGTVFIFAASQYGGSPATLNISELVRNAGSLNYQSLRLGFIFCLLGYGTKSGMFPLHSWLPDAHSEAPAPCSALLSGSLLNCALFGIWRVTEIVSAAGRTLLSKDLIIWAGTITVLAASFFLVRQHGFKRLWAYSSIENVGLMLVAIGTGSGAIFFLQAVNHSLAKVAAFLLAGNVVQAAGTKKLSEIRGIARVAPGWALLLALSAFAVTGAPPFGAFISEWLILTRSVNLKEWLVAILLVTSLALSFVAVCAHLGRVLFGKPRAGVTVFSPVKTSLVPACLVACTLILGFTTGADVFGLSP